MRSEEPYKRLYLRLFNRISDALADLERYDVAHAAEVLRKAQQEAEELYIDEESSR